MNIFVGNLSFAATEEDVRRAFADFGMVATVTIVMEKKGDKSRGFGFVEMPDDQEAQAAIQALNGRELLGRPLNIEPARPKKAKVERCAKREEKVLDKADTRVRAQGFPGESKDRRKDTWYSPVFNKTPGYSRYKQGRRSRSYRKRLAEAGIEEPAGPKQKNKENPMRWRKKQMGQPRPWQKSQEQPKPWKKPEAGPKPWRKTEGQPKPWQKKAGGSKPWQKSGAGPQQSGLSPSASPGMVRGNDGRSRAKGRKKPGGYKNKRSRF